MSNFTYTAALHRLTTGELVWDQADLRVLLLGEGYTPDRGHEFVADLGATELVASNYERKVLSGLAIVPMGDRVRLSASTVVWPDLGSGDSPMPEVGAAVIFEHDDDDELARLVCFIDSVAGPLTGDNATLAFAGGGVVDVVSP